MKAMLKNVVLSYVNLFEARKMNDSGDASYSVCLLIDKDDNFEVTNFGMSSIDRLIGAIG